MATNPDASPNKRIKTLTPTPQSPPSFISKGKSIVQEGAALPSQKADEIESTDCCGICLSESGNGGVSRGYIECCNHYFCFVCIMEWAKVESRCPLCKRRFSTIRRPRKPPVFMSERVVDVPVRDQVYHHFGNSSTGPPDPYSEVNCTVCHSMKDEDFMLLCDLCDSAAHTYCVGLGATVPEGDWFCRDCTLLKDEQSKSETNADPEVQISVHVVTPVSLSDIVQEPPGLQIPRRRRAASDQCYLPPRSSSADGPGTVSNITRPSPEIARTLRHHRDIHDCIRVLRENWNGLRSGILQFPPGNISSRKSVTCKSEKSSVPPLNQQQPTTQCSSSDTRKAEEIEKAWKMMDKAKSIKQCREGSSVARQSSKCAIRKLNALKDGDYTSYRHVSPDSQQNGSKKFTSTRTGKDYKHHNLKFSENLRRPDCEKLPTKGPACSTSRVMSDHASSSHGKLERLKEKSELKKVSVDSQQYNDAKSEIQSLVKLNIKLQTKEEKLEVDAFKEVARLATHTILGACGLEHPKQTGSCYLPGSICSHPDELKNSSLMPNSCRECFYVFVKNIVEDVISQKKSTYKKR